MQVFILKWSPDVNMFTYLSLLWLCCVHSAEIAKFRGRWFSVSVVSLLMNYFVIMSLLRDPWHIIASGYNSKMGTVQRLTSYFYPNITSPIRLVFLPRQTV